MNINAKVQAANKAEFGKCYCLIIWILPYCGCKSVSHHFRTHILRHLQLVCKEKENSLRSGANIWCTFLVYTKPVEKLVKKTFLIVFIVTVYFIHLTKIVKNRYSNG